MEASTWPRFKSKRPCTLSCFCRKSSIDLAHVARWLARLSSTAWAANRCTSALACNFDASATAGRAFARRSPAAAALPWRVSRAGSPALGQVRASASSAATSSSPKAPSSAAPSSSRACKLRTAAPVSAALALGPSSLRRKMKTSPPPPSSSAVVPGATTAPPEARTMRSSTSRCQWSRAHCRTMSTGFLHCSSCSSTSTDSPSKLWQIRMRQQLVLAAAGVVGRSVFAERAQILPRSLPSRTSHGLYKKGGTLRIRDCPPPPAP
mmetsp:Transcript_36797/g.104764  ORF Transcript_36797/g.104764 Transcript_36797/m.104764 type:complete len:265 (+) Transcript_36797:1074-1868(+)